jgi:hypothetical protein
VAILFRRNLRSPLEGRGAVDAAIRGGRCWLSRLQNCGMLLATLHDVSYCPKLSCASRKGGARLDPIVRELTMLTALACLGLGLAWAYEADYFAIFFAVAAAFAGVEAVRRSL